MRKWVDLFLFYATIMIIFSGIVLYIMPHGRVAYFTGWKFLGIDKDGWDNLHVIFGFLMVIVAIWHIVVNWKVMKKYLLQKESVFALLIIALVSIGTIKNVQPFKSVSDLEEYIKNSWEVSKSEIPIAHGELLSLEEFCAKLNIPLNEAIKKLKEKGVQFNVNETLKEIANKNNLTPDKVYEIIKPKKNSNSQNVKFIPGRGIGRMILNDFCKKYSCDVNEAIKNLKSKGINAKKTQTLKEIAEDNKITPLDIVKIITKH
jgi:biotin operon repressor